MEAKFDPAPLPPSSEQSANRGSPPPPPTLFPRGGGGGGSSVSAKGAYDNVTEELFLLNLSLCSLVLCSVKVSIQHLQPKAGGPKVCCGKLPAKSRSPQNSLAFGKSTSQIIALYKIPESGPSVCLTRNKCFDVQKQAVTNFWYCEAAK